MSINNAITTSDQNKGIEKLLYVSSFWIQNIINIFLRKKLISIQRIPTA